MSDRSDHRSSSAAHVQDVKRGERVVIGFDKITGQTIIGRENETVRVRSRCTVNGRAAIHVERDNGERFFLAPYDGLVQVVRS